VRAASAQPPVVAIEGALPGVDLEWVIGDLAWGDSLRDESTGVLLRQLVDVTLNQHVASTVLIRKHDPASTAPTNYKRYRIKKGDSLHRVAVSHAPRHAPKKVVAKLAARIKSINKIRDPKTYFAKHVGRVILIP